MEKMGMKWKWKIVKNESKNGRKVKNVKGNKLKTDKNGK